ncbi:SigE family RNA polymerase sigma factor [Virgisporangium ochraceum]
MRADLEREYVEYARASLDRLRRMAYVLCGDRHLAADVVQETLVRVYTNWHRVRAVEHVDAYVHRMLLRRFLEERRRPWTRIRLTPTVPEPVPPDPPAAVEDRSAGRVALVAALRQVPPRQRAVLVLRFLYDLPVDEVAALLDTTPGTVKSQTSRGLTTLRRLLDEPVAAGTSRGSDDDGS